MYTNVSFAAFFKAAFTSSAVTFLFNSRTKSTTEPVATGTRIATPSSLPSRFGQTLPIAEAAPVEVGTILAAQARPRRALIPFLWATSSVTWSFV